MLITPGSWKGRGRFLYQGESLGSVVELEFQASRDTHGEHIEGTISPETGAAFPFAVHVVEDDTGTFQVTASGGPALEGTAKLESEPNLAMLWSEDGSSMASVALFSTPRGCGCRGFHRRPVGVLTWEIVLTANQPAQRGGNVVSLSSGRKRR